MDEGGEKGTSRVSLRKCSLNTSTRTSKTTPRGSLTFEKKGTTPEITSLCFDQNATRQTVRQGDESALVHLSEGGKETIAHFALEAKRHVLISLMTN